MALGNQSLILNTFAMLCIWMRRLLVTDAVKLLGYVMQLRQASKSHTGIAVSMYALSSRSRRELRKCLEALGVYSKRPPNNPVPVVLP